MCSLKYPSVEVERARQRVAPCKRSRTREASLRTVGAYNVSSVRIKNHSMADSTPPLAGIRVVEVATFITGPYAGMLMSALGAEVIKVEPPGGGDPFRVWAEGGTSPRFNAFNRGKKSICVDLRSVEGRQVLYRLARAADVFIENHRPGVVQRLGVDYAALSEVNPQLIYCSISGFGQDGPSAGRPAYDQVGQAVSGLMSLLTDGRHPPTPIGPTFSDSLTGLFAVIGILSALNARASQHIGQHVRTSMLQATLGFLVEPIAHLAATGDNPGPYTRPHQSQSYGFRTADGTSLVIHLSTPDKFWRGLLRALECEHLADDPRFASYASRVTAYSEIEAALAPLFATRSRDEWLARLQAHDVPCAPVNSLADALADAQVAHLKLARQTGPQAWDVALPVELQGIVPTEPAPGVGEHTQELLDALGYTAAQTDHLRARNAVA
jgi:crotonobetainyl-CoA:carnitine CoA-transferase CaiB-like acyl-CoA transferase